MPLDKLPDLQPLTAQQIDSHTFELIVDGAYSLNQVFELLNQHHITHSMRTKPIVWKRFLWIEFIMALNPSYIAIYTITRRELVRMFRISSQVFYLPLSPQHFIYLFWNPHRKTYRFSRTFSLRLIYYTRPYHDDGYQ